MKKVVFMLTRVAYWNIFEMLYNQFEKNKEFEVVVLLCGETTNHVWIIYPNEMPKEVIKKDGFDKYNLTHSFDDLIEFAKNENLNYILGLDEENKDWVQLSDLNPDLVVYCDPYDIYYLNDDWKPKNASLKYKTIYIPYAYLLITTMEFYKLPIVQQAWKVFLETKSHMALAMQENENLSNNIVSFGYPKFDKYYVNSVFEGIDRDKYNNYDKKIIYSPHWTVSPKENRPYSLYGNFVNMKGTIVDIMRKRTDIFWIFRPHPLLFGQITFNYGIDTANDLYNEITSLDNVEMYIGYDYINLFKITDGIILDSNSFVAEYMPTEKPIIFIQKNEDMKLNSVGKDLIECCYRLKDFKDIDNTIEQIFVNGNDSLKNKRKKMVEKYILVNGENSPSTSIYNYLLNEIEKSGGLECLN